ncbi:hypothetical protein B0H17DRAFT_1138279 [Mycena rosella]|uniref:Uncharacterized protein n=1 Tax=Mycena rosella TaxID=1033263 RepID=A0AAD7GEL0_MYCRO|nr:hypothetical protein B0H17DRAFT_1138279 [Mycena rosella]
MVDVSHDPFRAPVRTPSAQSSSPAQRSAPPAAPPPTSDPTALTDEAPPAYTAGPNVYQGESTVEYGPSRLFQPAPPPLRQQPSGSSYALSPQHLQSTGWAQPQQAPSLWQQLTGATSQSPAQSSAGWSSYPGHQQYAPLQQPPLIHAPPPPPTMHISDFARDFYAMMSVPPSGFSDVSGTRATADTSTAGYPPPPPSPSLSPYQPPPGSPPPPSPAGPPDDGRPTRTPVPGHPLLHAGSMLVYPPHFEQKHRLQARGPRAPVVPVLGALRARTPAHSSMRLRLRPRRPRAPHPAPLRAPPCSTARVLRGCRYAAPPPVNANTYPGSAYLTLTRPATRAWAVHHAGGAAARDRVVPRVRDGAMWGVSWRRARVWVAAGGADGEMREAKRRMAQVGGMDGRRQRAWRRGGMIWREGTFTDDQVTSSDSTLHSPSSLPSTSTSAAFLHCIPSAPVPPSPDRHRR